MKKILLGQILLFVLVGLVIGGAVGYFVWGYEPAIVGAKNDYLLNATQSMKFGSVSVTLENVGREGTAQFSIKGSGAIPSGKKLNMGEKLNIQVITSTYTPALNGRQAKIRITPLYKM